jgi:hypothetical protein
VTDGRDGLCRLLARFRDLGHAGLLRVGTSLAPVA